jgi:hypothetical protein
VGSATANQTIRASAASCAALTPTQQLDAAKAVFDGRALAGPMAPHSGGVLATPARMRIERYLKGHGSAVVTVQTAVKAFNAGAVVVTEDGIQPHAGERWRIYTGSAREPYATSICLGSRKLPPRTSRFSERGISFDYPASWHART